MNYDNYKIADTFDKGRKIPDKTLQLWMDTILEIIPKKGIELIVDLGCGTGRLINAFQERYKAKIIGVEPSEKMLSEAKKNIQSENVFLISGNATNIPVDNNQIDLLFLSMVYHHIEHKPEAINEFLRVIKPGKYLCIRNATIESVKNVPYMKYFPSAIEINNMRLPGRTEIETEITKNGFSMIKKQVITQKFSDSWVEYCEKVKERTLSDLVLISDDEFNKGIELMYQDTHTENTGVYEDIYLFVFGKMV